MNIKELKSIYSETDLSQFPGDGQFRYDLFSPLLRNLFENKVVYYEKFIGIIKLENIIMSPERFEATAIPYLLIERKKRFDKIFLEIPKWNFSAQWQHMRLNGDSINVPYANWTIWCEPVIVKQVEAFTLDKKFSEALKLTLNSDE